MQSQNHWVNSLKSDCNFCHQLGNQLTRSVDHVLKAKPELKTHAEAWEWRLGTGVRGNSMYGVLTNQGPPRALKTYSDWTERVAKGEVPPMPPRPTGVERNVVLTLWDWGTDKSFMHDEISTDKNRPTVNAGGPVYAVSAGHGMLTMVDPKTHRTEEIEIPTRAPRAEVPSRFPKPNRPSLHWGEEHLWANPPYNPADPHNAMLDSKGRVWMTSKIRPNANAAWCSNPANSFASWFPLRQSGRQASFYDPNTRQFVLIDTCYATHHLQFDNDANETLYFNELTGPIFGWIDTKIFDQTKDEQKAVGWCGQVVDTNGDGKITAPPWNQITARGESILYSGDTGGAPAPGGRAAGGGAPAPAGGPNPKLDTMVSFSLYAVIPSPVDDSVWGVSERYPGYLVRLDRGKNPPQSCITEVYKVPEPGFDPRGVDIDTNGVVWTALAASSHMASFDRRKCKAITGPRKADGSECPEGWTLYQTPGPKLKGTNIPADFHYYNWVDQHNILGLGANKPMATGSNSDSILVLDPQTRRWVTLRVPYPLGFYSRGLDGRIDDPNGGLEGPRAVCQLRHALRVAHRRRQGHEGQAGEVPAAARSAGALTLMTRATPRRRAGVGWRAAVVLVARPSAQPPRPQAPPDISGEWTLETWEEDTSGQPPLGDYLGIPFNDAGRHARRYVRRVDLGHARVSVPPALRAAPVARPGWRPHPQGTGSADARRARLPHPVHALAGPADLHGRPAAPARLRAAHLDRVLHRPVGRQHA